jgi:16S rRNA (guanine966-N2)-methyltransferase
VESFLARGVPEAPFDLVLLDPPYDAPSADIVAVLRTLASGGLVAPGARVVIERPKGGEPVTLPEGWGIEKERAYGDTLLVVATA